MNNIQENYSLKPYNTFHLDVKAKYFTQLRSKNDIEELVNSKAVGDEKHLILGRGAKVLFSGDYDGLVINMNTKGKRVIKEDNNNVWLEVHGGEDWPELVRYTINKGWGGLENLALIPGTAGAAPVQNIGAYGRSLEDILISVEAINLITGDTYKLSKDECELGYRDSVFKHNLANNFLITKITIKLEKERPLDTNYHSRYESILSELEKFINPPYTPRNVYQTVANIRRRNLPNINIIGSVGCFFKNPIVDKAKLKELHRIAPEMQYHSTDNERFKIPAGWLLEKIGWKGKRVGNCGTWNKHALIVVNYGNATPRELLDFTENIKEDFNSHYGVLLENEAVVI